VPSLFLGLLVVASFLLGLRVGLAMGYRAERRRIRRHGIGTAVR
jgi:hypothetical protein